MIVNKASLPYLPPEIWSKIFKDVKSKGVFALSCKYFYNIAKNDKLASLTIYPLEIVHGFPGQTIDSIVNHAQFLRKYAPESTRNSWLGYASKHNYETFIKAFRFLEDCRGRFSGLWKYERHITKSALLGGNIHIINRHLNWKDIDYKLVREVVKFGNLNSLRYLCSIKYQILNEYLISNAALHGHLHIIKWARSYYCPWNAFATSYACQAGHLDILQYLLDNKCPCNNHAINKAIKYKHIHIVKYLLENKKCVFDIMCIALLLATNDLEFIKQVEEIKNDIFKPRVCSFPRSVHIDKKVIDYVRTKNTIVRFNM